MGWPADGDIPTLLWERECCQPSSAGTGDTQTDEARHMALCLVLGRPARVASGGCRVLLRRMPKESIAVEASLSRSGPMVNHRKFFHVYGTQPNTARKAAGMNQTVVASRAGIGRGVVSYWETKLVVDTRGWAPKRMFDVFGLLALRTLLRAGARDPNTCISVCIRVWHRFRNQTPLEIDPPPTAIQTSTP